jgi:hypothetical protein
MLSIDHGRFMAGSQTISEFERGAYEVVNCRKALPETKKPIAAN